MGVSEMRPINHEAELWGSVQKSAIGNAIVKEWMRCRDREKEVSPEHRRRKEKNDRGRDWARTRHGALRLKSKMWFVADDELRRKALEMTRSGFDDAGQGWQIKCQGS